MKKLLFAFSALCIACQLAQAQPADFNRIIQPVDVKAKDFGEYLVQLAWFNGPENSIVQDEVKNAKDELKITKKEWLKDMQVTFNLNEANLMKKKAAIDSTATGTDNVFFPRYNIGLNLNIGNILSQKDKNSIKRRDINIANDRVNQRKMEVRSAVLQRYQEYLLTKEILKTRTQIEQDANGNFVLIGQLHKTDEKTFEDYNEASTAYHKSVEDRMKAETEVKLARLRIEELTGVPWEEIQHPAKD